MVVSSFLVVVVVISGPRSLTRCSDAAGSTLWPGKDNAGSDWPRRRRHDAAAACRVREMGKQEEQRQIEEAHRFQAKIPRGEGDRGREGVEKVGDSRGKRLRLKRERKSEKKYFARYAMGNRLHLI